MMGIFVAMMILPLIGSTLGLPLSTPWSLLHTQQPIVETIAIEWSRPSSLLEFTNWSSQTNTSKRWTSWYLVCVLMQFGIVGRLKWKVPLYGKNRRDRREIRAVKAHGRSCCVRIFSVRTRTSASFRVTPHDRQTGSEGLQIICSMNYFSILAWQEVDNVKGPTNIVTNLEPKVKRIPPILSTPDHVKAPCSCSQWGFRILYWSSRFCRLHVFHHQMVWLARLRLDLDCSMKSRIHELN